MFSRIEDYCGTYLYKVRLVAFLSYSRLEIYGASNNKNGHLSFNVTPRFSIYISKHLSQLSCHHIHDNDDPPTTRKLAPKARDFRRRKKEKKHGIVNKT